MTDVVGILLAAGASSRFGADKLMHPLPGGTPIALASALALRAALPRMLAVVRADNKLLIELFAQNEIETVIAERAAEGMSASLARGVAATADAGGWLIALADMPAVRTATSARIAAAVRDGAPIAAPAYQGQRGHPVGFAARFGGQLRNLSGDEGARALLRDHAIALLQIECGDPGVLADIDLPADLGRIAR